MVSTEQPGLLTCVSLSKAVFIILQLLDSVACLLLQWWSSETTEASKLTRALHAWLLHLWLC
jgi:hypothetical protein